MKQRTAYNIEGLVMGFAFFLLIWSLMQTAEATKPKPPPPKPQPTITLDQRQVQALQSQSLSKSASQSSAQVGDTNLTGTLTGGDNAATGGNSQTGDWVNVSEHTFYSYAQSDKPAAGCFISGDGAAGKDGKFGALGFYWLDHNCWADFLAANERDVDLNARLRCYGRKYRNAIAYDVKGRRARQEACIERVKSSGLARIEKERAVMQAEIDKLQGQKDDLMDLRTIEQDQMQRMRQEVEAKRLREATSSK